MIRPAGLARATAILWFALSPLAPTPASAQLAEGVTTAAAVNVVSTELRHTMDAAVNRADYVTAKAALQMLGAIDAWKAANESLLDKAFTDVNASQRQIFANAEKLLADGNAIAGEKLATAQKITRDLNQLSESFFLNSGRTYVLDYGPQVVSPTTRDTLLLQLDGVNFDRGDPALTVYGTAARRNLEGPTAAVFMVPVSALAADPRRLQVHTLELRHLTKVPRPFWPDRTEPVERQLTVMTLPTVLADYQFSGVRALKRRETKAYTADAGRFQETNADVKKVGNPESGWLWDFAQGRGSFAVVSTGKGEAGSCEELLWNESNEHGIMIRAHLDRISHWNPFHVVYGPGYSNCGVSGPEYREVPGTEALPETKGQMSWTRSVDIPLPEGTQSFRLLMKTFDGREVIVTGPMRDSYFSVTQAADRLVIQPIVPQSLSAR